VWVPKVLPAYHCSTLQAPGWPADLHTATLEALLALAGLQRIQLVVTYARSNECPQNECEGFYLAFHPGYQPSTFAGAILLKVGTL